MERRNFMKLVAKQASGCWHWLGSRRGAYGQCSAKDEPSRYAHRLAYRMFKGDIPDGLHILHRCDNPVCVRPAHLWAGTRFDNQQDAVKKGRHTRTDEFKAVARSRRLEAWRAGTYTHLINNNRKRKRVTDGYL